MDREIIKLVSRRAALTVKLIQGQSNPQKSLFSPFADDQLSELIKKGNPGPLTEPAVRGIFREMISGARGVVKTLKIAYLGPAYSFTHLAAMERFGSATTLIPVNSIAAVFEEVNRGHADYGIAPIENSTDGRVVDTLDMFTRLPLKICGEVQLAIHHNLMARCQRSEIAEIYSKPQALSQCRDWLSRNMAQARLIEVTSTSTAAQLARDKFGAAAVASRQAAVQYELQIVAEHIEDNKCNVTRFAVIGDEATRSTGDDKTAVLLQIPHKPGALAEALTAFKKNNVNLTWIESFPLKGPEVGYVFFLEFEGHAADARTKRTVGELERKALRLELLGSYPRSEPVE
ncbi:MAG TPA: prephenate dehydratase [Planctomycetaceae bacterium]|nr:prephenate dehydratase [Planctomycetaceae bacterium]